MVFSVLFYLYGQAKAAFLFKKLERMLILRMIIWGAICIGTLAIINAERVDYSDSDFIRSIIVITITHIYAAFVIKARSMKYTIELVGTVLNGRDVVKTREKRFAEDTSCRT